MLFKCNPQNVVFTKLCIYNKNYYTCTSIISFADVNVYVLPMQSRALQCEVCNVSSAGATSEWFYKNQSSPEIKLMTEPNKYSISNDQLIIMNTIKSDRGRYRCVLMPVKGDPVNGSFAIIYTVLSELVDLVSFNVLFLCSSLSIFLFFSCKEYHNFLLLEKGLM